MCMCMQVYGIILMPANSDGVSNWLLLPYCTFIVLMESAFASRLANFRGQCSILSFYLKIVTEM